MPKESEINHPARSRGGKQDKDHLKNRSHRLNSNNHQFYQKSTKNVTQRRL